MTSPSSPVDSIAKAMEGVTPPDKLHVVFSTWKADGSLNIRRWSTFMEFDGSTAYITEHAVNAVTEERDRLARQAEAMKREMAEKDAEASWHPITTCPIREPVDLWCVYGGEEFAQYDGGASIGKVVPNRHKTEEYGFFGNQSNDGVPQGHARDLIPVAWRKAVPQCPSELIAEVLGIPRTIEDARALIGGGDD